MAEVTIEKLVYGGEGLGRLPTSEVIFVPWSAPDDIIEIGTPQKSKGVHHGEIQKILKPSSVRITPQCSVFEICGGCHWQHLPIEAQRQWKQTIVKETLSRIAKLDVAVSETIGSESPWYYRNKTTWVVFEDSGKFKLGYQQWKSHDTVAFDTCWIIPEAMNQLADWLENHQSLLQSVQNIQVQTNSEGALLLMFSTTATSLNLNESTITELVKAFPKISGIIARTGKATECIYGLDALEENFKNKLFRFSSNSFFQVNQAVTQKMLDVIESALPAKISNWLDLYSGVGLFSIYFSERFQSGVAIESNPSANAEAQDNLATNQVNHVELKTGIVEKILPTLESQFDVTVVDPPRDGCDKKVLSWLNENIANQIVYISCNPSTLARDLKILCENTWQVELVQPFDMFSQTYHIETVVVLKRR